MIKHIVMWKCVSLLTKEELRNIKKEAMLLNGKIEGLIEISFQINPLSSSTHDLMLISLHESKEALDHYQNHPLHKSFGAYLKPLVTERACFDFEV